MFSRVDDVGMSCSPQQKVGGSALPTLRRQARLSLADLRSAEKETVLSLIHNCKTRPEGSESNSTRWRMLVGVLCVLFVVPMSILTHYLSHR